jgi:hypothetical protein
MFFNKIKRLNHHPFIILVAKPIAMLLVKGMPRFDIVAGKRDVAAVTVPPHAVVVGVLVMIFVTVDKIP